jgi:hypothetical protein
MVLAMRSALIGVLIAAALLPLGGCFVVERNVLPNVGVKTDLQTGLYRCVGSGGELHSVRIDLRQIGSRYQYVATRQEGDTVVYALHRVSGRTYLATTGIAKGSSSIAVVILRVDVESVEYVFPPRSLVESLAPRYGVRVDNFLFQNNTLRGGLRNQVALMKAVATRVQFEGPSERCAKFY